MWGIEKLPTISCNDSTVLCRRQRWGRGCDRSLAAQQEHRQERKVQVRVDRKVEMGDGILSLICLLCLHDRASTVTHSTRKWKQMEGSRNANTPAEPRAAAPRSHSSCIPGMEGPGRPCAPVRRQSPRIAAQVGRIVSGASPFSSLQLR